MRPAECVSAPSLILQLHTVSGEIRDGGLPVCVGEDLGELSCLSLRAASRPDSRTQCNPVRDVSPVIRSRGPVRTPGMYQRTSGFPRADVGVFGGSGFYAFLSDAVEVGVTTEWGAPSAPVMVATVGGLRVAFLPRHGRHHELPAHRVDYRANVAAMQALGVRALIAPFAGGIAATRRYGPATWWSSTSSSTARKVARDTFYDHFDDGSVARVARRSLRRRAPRALSSTVATGGTHAGARRRHRGRDQRAAVLDPRRVARWFSRMGWDVVNMTQYPEAALAREAGIPYAGSRS